MTTDESLDRATRGTALNLVGALSTTLAGFGAVWLVSYEYGRAVAGALFTAVGLLTIAAGAAKLGTESSTTWYVSTRRHLGDGVVRDVVSAALVRVTLVAAAAGLLMAATSGPLADLLVDEPELEGEFQKMLVVLGLAIPAWAAAQASYGVSRGLGSMRHSVVTGSIVRPLVLLCALSLVVFVSDSLWALALAWLVSGLAALALSVWWLGRCLSAERSPSPAERRVFWSYTRPRAGSDVVHSVLERVDLVVLSALAGSAAAGGFAAAGRLVLMGQLLLVAVAQAVAPFVGAHLGSGRPEEADRLVRTLTTWSTLVTWPPMLVLAMHAEALTGVFGGDFTEAAPLVQVMAVGLAVMAALGPGDSVLLMTGDSRGSLWNHIAALVVMLAVAFVSIPVVGALGAAVAWSASRLTMRLLSVWRIRRACAMRCVDSSVLLAISVAVSSYVPVRIVGWRWGLEGLAGVSLTVLGGSVLFVAVAASRSRDLHLEQLPDLMRKPRRSQAARAA